MATCTLSFCRPQPSTVPSHSFRDSAGQPRTPNYNPKENSFYVTTNDKLPKVYYALRNIDITR